MSDVELASELRRIAEIGIVNYKHDRPILMEAAARLQRVYKENEKKGDDQNA